MTKLAPVINEASLDAKNATPFAISNTFKTLLSGVIFVKLSENT